MKRSRLIVLGILGLVLAVGLTGCKIISATPNPSVPVVMKLGGSQTFKVDGPEENASTRYEWYYYGHPYSPVGSGKQFTFVADLQKYRLYNRMTVECHLVQYRLIYIGICAGCQSGGGGWHWEWITVDKKIWNIRIPQDAPVWQGNYLIENKTDINLLKGFTTITGDLENYESKLVNFAGLEGLISVGGDLFIYDDSSLTSLTGLENLASVGGNLEVDFCASLTSLSALQNLTSVDGNLDVTGNAALTSLGMTGLQKVGSDFEIMNNTMLCNFLAEELRDQVLAEKGIGGKIIIGGPFGNKDCTTP